MCGWGWGWGGNGWGGWGGTLMSLALAVFFVALIIAVVFTIRHLARSGSQRSEASSAATRTGPEDTLARRLASGEVDEDECRQRIALLRQHL
jgi:putative membrane protein